MARHLSRRSRSTSVAAIDLRSRARESVARLVAIDLRATVPSNPRRCAYFPSDLSDP